MPESPIPNLYDRRKRQTRWQHHSSKEREALADLALGIERYLAQASPGNINNAAFVDYALPHLQKMKQLFATAKPKRLRMLANTLRITAEAASDPKERDLWNMYADIAGLQAMNRL